MRPRGGCAERPATDSVDKNAKIYVAGHRGLVGSALVRALERHGYRNLLVRTHAELELTDQAATHRFFKTERPDCVLLAAAKVGGIHANRTYPAEFIRQNLAIQDNVIHEAWRAGVRNLLFLGSSCIYPRDCPQPIREDYLLTGLLEETNRPNALAKIAGIELCWSYNRQYGTRYLTAIPTSLYGPGDNYDLENSHVLPALIRKMHEAKRDAREVVTLWGSGTPRREFLYSEDMAEACLHLLKFSEAHAPNLYSDRMPPLVNIGCGSDLTIADLARVVADAVGFKGTFAFDPSKPDGTPRKLLDVSKIASFGWSPAVSLKQGIANAYATYLEGNK